MVCESCRVWDYESWFVRWFKPFIGGFPIERWISKTQPRGRSGVVSRSQGSQGRVNDDFLKKAKGGAFVLKRPFPGFGVNLTPKLHGLEPHSALNAPKSLSRPSQNQCQKCRDPGLQNSSKNVKNTRVKSNQPLNPLWPPCPNLEFRPFWNSPLWNPSRICSFPPVSSKPSKPVFRASKPSQTPLKSMKSIKNGPKSWKKSCFRHFLDPPLSQDPSQALPDPPDPLNQPLRPKSSPQKCFSALDC